MTNAELKRALRRIRPDLRGIRERAGLTRADVAREVGAGDHATVYAWETGRRTAAGMLGERYLAFMLRLAREHPPVVQAEAEAAT